MIGVIATLKVMEGKGSEFEAIAKQLVEQVNSNEEGVITIYSNKIIPPMYF